jgi:hypothetical protein
MDPITPGDDIDDVSFAEWLTGESHFTCAAEQRRHGYTVDVRPKSKPKTTKATRQGPAPRAGQMNRNRRAGSFDSARAGASGTSSSRVSQSDANASAATDAARAPSAGSRTSGHGTTRQRTGGSMFHWLLCLHSRDADETSHDDVDECSVRGNPAEEEPTPTSKRSQTPIDPISSIPRIRPVTTTTLRRQTTLDSLARIDSISESGVDAAVMPSTPPISWNRTTPSAYLNEELPFDPPLARRTATTHVLAKAIPTHSTASSHAPRRNSIG